VRAGSGSETGSESESHRVFVCTRTRCGSARRGTGAAVLRPTGSDTEAMRSAFEGETGDARIIADFVQANFLFLKRGRRFK
jgi:hypothetical protein